MTINSYWYNSGNGSVRVEAESYEQITSSGKSGQCPGILYRVTFTQNWEFTQYGSGGGPGRLGSTVRTWDARGPIVGPEHYYEYNIAHALIRVGPNAGIIAWNARGGRRTLVTDSLPPTDISIVPLEPEPEYCRAAESCVTKFYRGGQVIHEINSCPDISENPPSDGCPCCRELLPIARSIAV